VHTRNISTQVAQNVKETKRERYDRTFLLSGRQSLRFGRSRVQISLRKQAILTTEKRRESTFKTGHETLCSIVSIRHTEIILPFNLHKT